jgi:cytosine deaminase
LNITKKFIETPYFESLRKKIAVHGGIYNSHLHMDRSGTLDFFTNEKHKSALSLQTKHSLIQQIHNSNEYDVIKLKNRVSFYLNLMHKLGTTKADTFVDVTDDKVQLSALNAFNDLKRTLKIQFKVGAYSPLGFSDKKPGRWTLIEKAAKTSDFLGSLPERDSKRDYPTHIGFYENIIRFIDLAKRTKKPLHIHVDQRNDPRENGSELVLKTIEKYNFVGNNHKDPIVWLVHVISPSLYSEKRFMSLIKKMKELHVGVICCPSAAISMRQLRLINSPTFNSIARVLDFLQEGIPVRIGSDNICDITSPAGTVDLIDELFVLSNALRYYDQDILAKLGAGKNLNSNEIEAVKEHIQLDKKEVRKSIKNYSPDFFKR